MFRENIRTWISARSIRTGKGKKSPNILDSQEALRRWEQRWRNGSDFLRWPVTPGYDRRPYSTLARRFHSVARWVSQRFLSRRKCSALPHFRLERGVVTYADQIALAEELLHRPEAARRIRGKNDG